jgi:hypothetical protein
MSKTFLKNQKIHWVVKANYIADFWIKSDKNIRSAAYELEISEDTFWDYLLLANFLHQYPKLSNIPNKSDALNLIKQFEDAKQFRALLNFTVTKYKSVLILNNMRKKIYEGSIDS